MKINKGSKESTTASSEDSKEIESNIEVSDSDSDSEKDSSGSTDEKMSVSKINKPTIEDDDSVPPRVIKNSSSNADNSSAIIADSPSLDGPFDLKFTAVKQNSKNNQLLQHHLMGFPLVRTQNPSRSSVDRMQEKYYEDASRAYGVSYHNMAQSKEMQNSTLIAGNQGSNEMPLIQAKLGSENEGGIFKKNVEIPQTLVYTNSNFKSNVSRVDFLPPTHTASAQVPTSMVYTNTSYRNGRQASPVIPPERDMNHEMMRSFPGTHQQQRYTSVIKSVGNVPTLPSSRYENVCLVPSAPPMTFARASSLPNSMLVSPPLSGSDPRLGHPLVHRMTNPVPSIPQMCSMPSGNSNFHPRYGAYNNMYPRNMYVGSPQNPQALSTVTNRDVRSGSGLPNSAKHYEDAHCPLVSSNNPFLDAIGDLSSSDSDKYLPPFSVFKVPNKTVGGHSGRNYDSKNRSKVQYDYNELKQLDRRAKLLTKNREQSTEWPCHVGTPGSSHISSGNKIQKEKRYNKHAKKITKMETEGEGQGEYKHTELQVTESCKPVLSADSTFSSKLP